MWNGSHNSAEAQGQARGCEGFPYSICGQRDAGVKAIDWQRGLLRLWMVVSCIWLILAGFAAYGKYTLAEYAFEDMRDRLTTAAPESFLRKSSAEEWLESEARKQGIEPPPPLSAEEQRQYAITQNNVVFSNATTEISLFMFYSALAPIVILIFAIALKWIGIGFLKTDSQENQK
jgi:hypothetical protein